MNLNLSTKLHTHSEDACEGILILNKPSFQTSFSLVSALRKILNVKKIGHAGTLDPFATGVMVMLIGKKYTRLSDQFLTCDKEYIAKVCLGVTTDTYDLEGAITATSCFQPTFEQILLHLQNFQGEIEQIPPMFSAKKQGGKKLYEIARKLAKEGKGGQCVERPPCRVKVNIELIDYSYPYLTLKVACSKGTYIRSLAYDLGLSLGCGGHLTELQRTRSGAFTLEQSLDATNLKERKKEELLKFLLQNSE